jgi:hypothetical protein
MKGCINMNFKEYLDSNEQALLKVEKLPITKDKLERELKHFSMRLIEKPMFNNVDKYKLLNAFLSVIEAGASFNPISKNIYFYPTEIKNKQYQVIGYDCILQYTLNFIIEKAMTMGLLKQPPILQVIKENDKFTCNFSTGDFNHEITQFPRGEIIGVYCQVLSMNDTKYIEIIELDEIKLIATKTKTKTSSVWNEFFGEMAKKAVFYRITKRMPTFTQNEILANMLNTDNQLYEFKNEAKELPEKAPLILPKNTDVEPVIEEPATNENIEVTKQLTINDNEK